METSMLESNSKTISDYLYVMSFILVDISYILLGSSTLGTVFDVKLITTPLNIFIYSMLIFAIIIQKKSVRQWVLVSLISLLALSIYMLSGEGTFLLFGLFMIGRTEIKLDRIIWWDFVAKIISIVFVMLSGIGGIIPTLVASRSFGSDLTLRYSMGFSHYNILGALVVSLILEWIYLRKQNLNMVDFGWIAVILLLMNHFVDSRTSFIVGILALILTVFSKLTRKILRLKLMKIISVGAYIEAAFISFFAAAHFLAGNGTGFWDRLNSMLSSRISIAQFYLQNSGVRVLPKTLPQYLNTGLVVLDNTYVYLGVHLGIIALVLFLLLMTTLGYRLLTQNNFYGMIVFICFAILGMMESTLFYSSMNFLVIFLATFDQRSNQATYSERNEGVTIN